MVDLGSRFFSSPFPFKDSFQNRARMNFSWVDVEDGVGRTTSTRVIPSILSQFQSFHGSRVALEDILALVLRTCPGTALL